MMADQQGKERQLVEQVVLLILTGLLFGWAALEARTFPVRARIFPQFVAGTGLILTLVAVARTLVVRLRGGPGAGANGAATWTSQLRAGLPYLLWVLGYYLGIWVLGFLLATFIFVCLVLILLARVRWYSAMPASLPLLAGLLVLGEVMNVTWPVGLVGEWIATTIFGW